MFPYKIQKKLENEQKKPYFMNDLSFYSKQHGGTFHFLQFNVLYSEKILDTIEFQHFIKFINKTYPNLESQKDHWGKFIDSLQLRKSILTFEKSEEFTNRQIKDNFYEMPILSTGGYNDTFLKFISNCFNTKIVKCREFMRFVITAIDYLNSTTNDCFFTMDRKSDNVLNYTGKLNINDKPPI